MLTLIVMVARHDAAARTEHGAGRGGQALR
jgi:hypothetical protein